jgi:hypothetical protein
VTAETTDTSHPLEEHRRNFRRLNMSLAGLPLLATGWTFYGTSSNVQRFHGLEHFFGSTKLPLPKLTMTVYDHNAKVIILLILLALSCVAATLRERERWETLLLNIAGVVLPLVWWGFHTAMFYDATISILGGIGSRVGP